MKTTAAYDLSQFAPSTEKEKQVRIVKNNKHRKNERKAFAAKFVLYMIAIVFLMSATVYSRLTLTETKAKINSYTSDLTELQSENAYLSYKIDSFVSLKNAEEYAVSELGLVKMDSSRIEYVNLHNENEIVVNDSKEDFQEQWKTFFSGVIDFFGG